MSQCAQSSGTAENNLVLKEQVDPPSQTPTPSEKTPHMPTPEELECARSLLMIPSEKFQRKVQTKQHVGDQAIDAENCQAGEMGGACTY